MAMMPSSPLIEAHGLSLRLGGRTILDQVSLRLDPGQHLTLIGPNGAGKSMLLKLLLGLLQPTAGTIVRQPDLRIGYMPQRLQLSPLMPCTVDYFLRLAGRYDASERLAALEATESAHLADRSVHALSGGEMQRVLLARTLLREPQALLLDEPGQNMDVSGQLAMYELIRRIQTARGCAVLMVSHDLHFVMRQTDQVYCLYHHICCSGRPQEIVEDKAFAELFGPRIAEVMGFYPHQHHGHTHEH